MKKRVLRAGTIVAALMLAGCQGSPMGNLINGERNYTLNDAMQSWVGSSESELVSSWGVPNGSYQNKDGTIVLTWQQYWETQLSYGYCKKIFLVDPQGVIRKWKYDSCATQIAGKTVPASTPVPPPTL